MTYPKRLSDIRKTFPKVISDFRTNFSEYVIFVVLYSMLERQDDKMFRISQVNVSDITFRI